MYIYIYIPFGTKLRRTEFAPLFCRHSIHSRLCRPSVLSLLHSRHCRTSPIAHTRTSSTNYGILHTALLNCSIRLQRSLTPLLLRTSTALINYSVHQQHSPTALTYSTSAGTHCSAHQLQRQPSATTATQPQLHPIAFA